MVQRTHKENTYPVDKVISLLPSTEDYQKIWKENTKLLIHPDYIPDTNISLTSRKQNKVSTEDSEISENYQDSHEKVGNIKQGEHQK